MIRTSSPEFASQTLKLRPWLSVFKRSTMFHLFHFRWNGTRPHKKKDASEDASLFPLEKTMSI